MISSGTDTSMRPQLRQTGHLAFSKGTYRWTHRPLKRKLTKALSAQKLSTAQVSGICARELRTMVHIKLRWYNATQLSGVCKGTFRRTDSVTTMLEELGWQTLEQHLIDSLLMALYKITRGLLFVDTHGLLRPATCKTSHTHNESFIPLVAWTHWLYQS